MLLIIWVLFGPVSLAQQPPTFSSFFPVIKSKETSEDFYNDLFVKSASSNDYQYPLFDQELINEDLDDDNFQYQIVSVDKDALINENETFPLNVTWLASLEQPLQELVFNLGSVNITADVERFFEETIGTIADNQLSYNSANTNTTPFDNHKINPFSGTKEELAAAINNQLDTHGEDRPSNLVNLFKWWEALPANIQVQTFPQTQILQDSQSISPLPIVVPLPVENAEAGAQSSSLLPPRSLLGTNGRQPGALLQASIGQFISNARRLTGWQTRPQPIFSRSVPNPRTVRFPVPRPTSVPKKPSRPTNPSNRPNNNSNRPNNNSNRPNNNSNRPNSPSNRPGNPSRTRKPSISRSKINRPLGTSLPPSSISSPGSGLSRIIRQPIIRSNRPTSRHSSNSEPTRRSDHPGRSTTFIQQHSQNPRGNFDRNPVEWHLLESFNPSGGSISELPSSGESIPANNLKESWKYQFPRHTLELPRRRLQLHTGKPEIRPEVNGGERKKARKIDRRESRLERRERKRSELELEIEQDLKWAQKAYNQGKSAADIIQTVADARQKTEPTLNDVIKSLQEKFQLPDDLQVNSGDFLKFQQLAAQFSEPNGFLERQGNLISAVNQENFNENLNSLIGDKRLNRKLNRILGRLTSEEEETGDNVQGDENIYSTTPQPSSPAPPPLRDSIRIASTAVPLTTTTETRTIVADNELPFGENRKKLLVWRHAKLLDDLQNGDQKPTIL